MRGLRLGAAAVFLSGIGCSLLLSTAEPIQCRSQRDCDANPALRDRVCEDGFCVVAAPPPGPANIDAGEGCSTTTRCTQENSGKASVCKRAGGFCTPWQTEQCRLIRGDWAEPDPIVIGTILPFHVKQANGTYARYEYTERVQRAIDLGLEELRAALPDGVPVPAGTPRRFAVLHCDSYLDTQRAKDAMTHLTETVGAQVVIVGADRDLAAIRPQALAKKTALVCSDCVAPFPAGALAWRIVPALEQEAAMAAWRINQLEEQIKSGPTPPSLMKVAVLATPDQAPASFVSALLDKLRINGSRVVDDDSALLMRTTEDPTEDAVIHEAHADALAAFEPDVVVVAMGEEFPRRYLQLLETKWTTAKPKPHYVMTALNLELGPFAAVLGPADDDLRRRLSGTRPALDAALKSNTDAYTLRYKQKHSSEPPDGNFTGYDAFYATAYAVVAAAATAPVLDGPRIDASFARLRSGSTIDVGPRQLGTGIVLLGNPTGSVDLRGLVTHLDWDPATRDLVVTESSLFCFERGADGSLVLRMDAGPRLNTLTGEVSGAYACD